MTYEMDMREAAIEAAAERIRKGKFTATERRLLRLLDIWDGGEGVRFTMEPRGRNGHPATGEVFNDATFRPLNATKLIDVGDGHDDPVRITDAGRLAVMLFGSRTGARS